MVDDERLDEVARGIVEQLLGHAPLTMWASKQAVAGLRKAALPAGDDLVARAFGSADFRQGVRAFTSRDAPRWPGVLTQGDRAHGPRSPCSRVRSSPVLPLYRVSDDEVGRDTRAGPP